MRKNVGEQKKYQFTGDTMEFEGRTLHRIRYLRHGVYFEKGELGGWIESEDNLSHQGKCCIKRNAAVLGHARVMEDAILTDYAEVQDSAIIKGNSYVYSNTIIGADTIVSDDSHICGESKVFFYADEEYGRPNISGDSRIEDCTIEATGRIHNSVIENKQLFGLLDYQFLF